MEEVSAIYYERVENGFIPASVEVYESDTEMILVYVDEKKAIKIPKFDFDKPFRLTKDDL